MCEDNKLDEKKKKKKIAAHLRTAGREESVSKTVNPYGVMGRLFPGTRWEFGREVADVVSCRVVLSREGFIGDRATLVSSGVTQFSRRILNEVSGQ